MDHKTLKQKMAKAREQAIARCKDIQFVLPDLAGPGGNAFSLLGQAKSLMLQEGIHEMIIGQFTTEATSSDYEHLLATVSKWFTVVIPVTTYEPLGDRNIRDVMPKTVDDEDTDPEESKENE